MRVPWIAGRSNQSILKDITVIGRTDAEAETPILWPPDAKSLFIGKDPDAGKDKARGERGGRGGDGEVISLTQQTGICANSRR